MLQVKSSIKPYLYLVSPLLPPGALLWNGSVSYLDSSMLSSRSQARPFSGWPALVASLWGDATPRCVANTGPGVLDGVIPGLVVVASGGENEY